MANETTKVAEATEATVKVPIPYDDTLRHSNSLVLTINGKRMTFKRGETVDMPKAYADLLEKRRKIRRYDQVYKEELKKAAKPEAMPE